MKDKEKVFIKKVISVCENLKKAVGSLMDEAAQEKATDWGIVNGAMCNASDLIGECKKELKEE